MPTFVEIEPDPFATVFRSKALGDPNEDGTNPGSGRVRQRRSFDHVRRPVRGIQIKDDTYATIQVYTSDGRNIPLIDAGGSLSDNNNPDKAFTNQYSNFLLQAVVEQRAEKMQIIQTFGAPFVWFFGQQPRIIQCQGVLLNTEDFNWRAEFWANYENYLRGTKCVESNSRVTMSWDDIIVEGYFVDANAQESAEEPNRVMFDFKILLTNYQNVSRIGAAEFPRVSADEINLEPYSIDTTGEGIGNLKSDTQLVRELNSYSLANTKNSLLQSLREGIMGPITFNGTLGSMIEVADSLLYGRNIRVPLGASGGSVYDQDTQIALASVAPEDRYILLSESLGGHTFTIKAPLTKRRTNLKAEFGLIADNIDEYIARSQPVGGAPINPPDLFAEQKAKEGEMQAKVKEIFELFGVDTEPPSDAVLLARGAAFGVMRVLIGSVARSEAAAPLRQAANMLF